MTVLNECGVLIEMKVFKRCQCIMTRVIGMVIFVQAHIPLTPFRVFHFVSPRGPLRKGRKRQWAHISISTPGAVGRAPRGSLGPTIKGEVLIKAFMVVSQILLACNP